MVGVGEACLESRCAHRTRCQGIHSGEAHEVVVIASKGETAGVGVSGWA